MIVRLATEKDEDSIFKIWQACFTDDEAYIDNYLKYCLPYTRTWILGITESEIASCLSVIPSFVTINRDIYRGGYLYAVGTLPEHRGNSFSRILMDSAINDCRKAGFSYMLVKPATENLFDFYIKSSFDKAVSKGVLTIRSDNTIKYTAPLPETRDINASELFSMRTSSMNDTLFFWNESILNYALIEARSRGGQCKKFDFIDDGVINTIYFVSYPDDLYPEKIKILETNVKNQSDLDILFLIIKREYSNMEEISLDCSTNNLRDSRVVSQRSALFLTFNNELTPYLKRLHLSLPLE